MTEDMTGPALSGSIKRFDYDTLKFARYIRHPETYLHPEKDKRMILLHEQYGKMPKPVYENLTLDEVKSILLYIERNY